MITGEFSDLRSIVIQPYLLNTKFIIRDERIDHEVELLISDDVFKRRAELISSGGAPGMN